MDERVERGSWVEIRSIVLEPGQRAPGVPEDTAQVALELRVKGVLMDSATAGEVVEVVTRSGRRLCGTLLAVNPAYTHGFGPPIAALMDVGREARELLEKASVDESDVR